MKTLTWQSQSIPLYVLGTVQLGRSYGIANTTGMPSKTVAQNIVEAAWREGVRVFDTAENYGQSESVLGEILCRDRYAGEARVVSKIAPRPDMNGWHWITAGMEGCLQRLQTESIWGILLHQQEMIDAWDDGLGEALAALQRRGFVQHLGVSVYDDAYFERALTCQCLEIIQAPCNPWAPGVWLDGGLGHASTQGVLVFVRSLFLQGLLLMKPETVAKRLPQAVDASVRWWALCEELGESPYGVCLRFAAALGVPVVLGCESVAQARENGAFQEAEPMPRETAEWIRTEMTPLLSPAVTDPSRWGETSRN